MGASEFKPVSTQWDERDEAYFKHTGEILSPAEVSIDVELDALCAGDFGAPADANARTDARDTLPSPSAELALQERDAEALRRDQAERSAERKRTPLCTGLLDYAPDALDQLAHAAQDEFPSCGDDEVDAGVLYETVLQSLRFRDANGSPQWVEYRRMCLAALAILNLALGRSCAERPEFPNLASLFNTYADAFAAVAQVSWHGNNKHNPGQPLHHARAKSTDHEDCIVRHTVDDMLVPGGYDGEFQHAAALVWRCLILFQIKLEQSGSRRARGAR